MIEKILSKNKTRKEWILLSSIYGLICNLILFISKIVIGSLSGAISLVSDAFNNLSDFLNSIIGLVAAWVADKPADENHPFGHGRFEYLSTQVVSFIILYIGIQLLISSFNQIINPQPLNTGIWLFIVLGLSIILKASMWFYNQYINRKTESDLIYAVVVDSRADVLSSIILIIAMLIQPYTHLPLDGIGGLILSLMLLKQGIELLKNTWSKLLGKKLSDEVITKIDQLVNQDPDILGYHNLKGHDYGVDKVYVSIDVELPDTMDINRGHDITDRIERRIKDELGVDVDAHIDPISSDPQLNKVMFELVEKLSVGFFSIDDIVRFDCVKGHLRTSVFIILDEAVSQLSKDKFVQHAKKEAQNVSFHVS